MGSAAPAAEPPAPIEGTLLPEGKFDGVRLDDFLDMLKEKVPGFNGVIVRSPGVPTDYPTLPPMTTKNVTVGQFLEFIKSAFPGVGVKRIDGPTAPLYVIRIDGYDGQPLPGSGNTAGTRIEVTVFPLGKIIDKLTFHSQGKAEDKKKALDDVLSLVEAAMKEEGGDQAPTLQVHEATQTLLAKGTEEQLGVLNHVLQTLTPTEEEWKAQQAARDSESEFLKQARVEAEVLMAQNQDLRAQLAAQRAATTQPQK